MDRISCVKGEIHNCLSLLRLNHRSAYRQSSHSTNDDAAFRSSSGASAWWWGFGGGTPETEADELKLVRSFTELHDHLGFYSDLSNVDTRAYVLPFCRVIASSITSTSLTTIALQSLSKFLLYGLIDDTSPGVQDALHAILDAVLGCQFEKTNQAEDEAIHLKIMDVLLETLRCPMSFLLSDDAVCRMIEECFSMRSRSGGSRILRKYAENILVQMVLVVFKRLVPETAFEVPAAAAVPLSASTHSVGTPTKLLPKHSNSNSSNSNSRDSRKREHKTHRHIRSHTPHRRSPSMRALRASDDKDETVTETGYGEEAMRRVLAFLVACIDPSDYRNTVHTREFCLRLINTALEAAGKHIADYPLLMEVVKDQLCKRLLQNSQSRDLSILTLTLRIVFDLFYTVKEHLKVQLEVFFTSMHLRIAEAETSTFEMKELVLESLVEFCHEPELIVGIYRSYDCELGSTNLFEDLCRFMSGSATPRTSHEELTELQLLSSEGILAVMDSVAKWFCAPQSAEEQDHDPSGDGEDTGVREEKKKLANAAKLFNQNGKECFSALQRLRVLSTPLTPDSVAHFLRHTPGLDKLKIGEYLGGSKPFVKEVLQSYVNTFHFHGMTIDAALRSFLESFMLRGEAQQIERIMELFAGRLFEQSPGPMANADAAFILSYSIIMLNTDAHNDQVTRKMTLEQFSRTISGCNDSNNFPAEFVASLYHSITGNEIMILNEDVREMITEGSGVQEAQWSRLLKKSQQTGAAFKTTTVHSHGKEMFLLIWQPTLHILTFHLDRALHTSRRRKLHHRIIEGFHTFASICAVYQLDDIFNKLLIALSNAMAGVLEECEADPSGHSPSVSFGRRAPAQRVASLLFSLVLRHGPSLMKEAWHNTLHVVLWLRRLGLLDVYSSLLAYEDFRDASGRPLQSLKISADSLSQQPPQQQTSDASSSMGFFTSSLLGFFAPTDEELDDVRSVASVDSALSNATADDEDYTLMARDAVKSLHIDCIFSTTPASATNTRLFSPTSLQHLVRALVVVSTSPHTSPPAPHDDPSLPSESVFHPRVLGDEAAVFCLERLSDVVEANLFRLDTVWPVVKRQFHVVLQTVQASNDHTPTYYLERFMVNLLRLCIRLVGSEKWMGEAMSCLSLLSSTPLPLLAAFADRITAGVLLLLKSDGSSLRNPSHWKVVFSLLQPLAQSPKGCFGALNVVEHVVEHQVDAENFTVLLQTLSCFVLSDAASSQALQGVELCRPSRVLELCVRLYSRLATLQQAASSSADVHMLAKLWLRCLNVLCQMARNSRYDVSKHALDCLQRVLLATPSVTMHSPEAWRACFQDLLLPLLPDAHRTHQAHTAMGIAQKQGQGHTGSVRVEDLRLRVCSLLFQVFLQHVEVLVLLADFHVFWLRFMGTIERWMRTNAHGQVGEGDNGSAPPAQDDILAQHFTERLKNCILVLRAAGTLEKASQRTGQDLWALTWTVIEGLRPGLRTCMGLVENNEQ